MLYSLGRRQHKSLPKAVEKRDPWQGSEDGLKACQVPVAESCCEHTYGNGCGLTLRRWAGSKQRRRADWGYMLENGKTISAMPEIYSWILLKEQEEYSEDPLQKHFSVSLPAPGEGCVKTILKCWCRSKRQSEWIHWPLPAWGDGSGYILWKQGEGHQWDLGHSILRNTLEKKIELNTLKNLPHFNQFLSTFSADKRCSEDIRDDVSSFTIRWQNTCNKILYLGTGLWIAGRCYNSTVRNSYIRWRRISNNHFTPFFYWRQEGYFTSTA